MQSIADRRTDTYKKLVKDWCPNVAGDMCRECPGDSSQKQCFSVLFGDNFGLIGKVLR